MYLGIDFGGSHIKYGLVHDKTLLCAQQFSISGLNFDEIMMETTSRVKGLLAVRGIPDSSLEGIAIAVPGVVNSDKGELLSLPKDKYTGAMGFDFTAWSESNFGVKADLFNDAILALLGEVWAGAGQGCKDTSLVIIGTGIGTSVMMNGKVLRSRNHVAGNLGGHLVAQPGGVDCICGSKGCIEAYAANWSLHYRVHENYDLTSSSLRDVERIDYRSVFDRFYADEVAHAVGESLILHWSHVVINLLHAYDSELVILSGSVFNSPVNLLERIETYVKQNVWLPEGCFRIAVAADPTNSVLFGAESKKQNYFR